MRGGPWSWPSDAALQAFSIPGLCLCRRRAYSSSERASGSWRIGWTVRSVCGWTPRTAGSGAGARHGDLIVLSAELELAAWDAEGQKCWSTFVEPPWAYKVSAGIIELDVMGDEVQLSTRRGTASNHL